MDKILNKQAAASETDRTSECGSACILVLPPDPKVYKLATRSTCMDGGCISNKLDLKAYAFPPFAIIRRVLVKEGQVHIDHNNTSVAFSTILHPVVENVYTLSNFHSSISKSFDRHKPGPIPIVSESKIGLSGMEGLRQQYSADGLSN